MEKQPPNTDSKSGSDSDPHAPHGIPHDANDDEPKGTPSDRHATETAANEKK